MVDKRVKIIPYVDYVGVLHDDGSYTIIWLYEGTIRSQVYEADTVPEGNLIHTWLRDIAKPAE